MSSMKERREISGKLESAQDVSHMSTIQGLIDQGIINENMEPLPFKGNEYSEDEGEDSEEKLIIQEI